MAHKLVLIYVLKLEDDCYYVGQTRDLNKRLADHIEGSTFSSKWVRLHPFVNVACVIPVTKEKPLEAENRITLKWMKMKGRCKVRGGSYHKPQLSANMDLKCDVQEMNELMGGYESE